MIIKNGETQPTYTLKNHEMYDWQIEQAGKLMSDLNGYWVIIERNERDGQALIGQLTRHEGQWHVDESFMFWAWTDDLERTP